MTSQAWPLVLFLVALVHELNGITAVSASLDVGSCRSEPSCLNSLEEDFQDGEGHDEEESDDVTLLAMPMKTSARTVGAHRSGSSRQPAPLIHHGDAPSLFQTDEVVNHAGSKPASDAADEVRVEPEAASVEQAAAAKPMPAPPLADKVSVASDAIPPVVKPESPEKAQHQVLVIVCVLMLGLLLVAWMLMTRGKAESQVANSAELQNMVRSLQVSSAQEILGMFACRPEDSAAKALSPGILTRLEGRIVAKSGQSMATPFSDRSCVMYSASASQKRQDGVHQPPLAYYAACSDFMIELGDANDGEAPVQISVHGHDVSLFQMSSGRFSEESPFSDVPESWRGFALAHLIHAADASCNAMSHVELGTKGALEFCECSLLDGAVVTCVGEIARDRNGSLSLLPWRPPIIGLDTPPSKPGRVANLKRAVLGKLGKTSWEDPRNFGEVASPLAGQVLISDSPELPGGYSSFWQQFSTGKSWNVASLI